MSLIGEVLDLLNGQALDDDVRAIALAAVEGAQALEAVLAGGLDALEMPDEDSQRPAAPQAFLRSIEVAGFRGVGPTSTVDLTPGPGLTVIAGRNGSGKSSFADALEVLLTGDSWRWKGKAVEWKRGWRNLHDGAAPRVAASFDIEGQRGSTNAWREWNESALEASLGDTVVQPPGGKRTDISGLGWSTALDLYRPILSHSELGVVASNPSSLFDALTGVLGVEPLLDASALLRSRRLDLEKSLKEAKKQVKDSVLPMLGASGDDRASTAQTALGTSKWDLDVIERLAGGGEGPDPAVRSLRSLAEMKPPDRQEVENLAESLQSVLTTLAQLEKAEAGRAARLASIIHQVLDEHEEHGDADCPVCGTGRLDEEWRNRAMGEVEILDEAAAEYRDAGAERDRLEAQVQRLAQVPFPLGAGSGLDLGEYDTVLGRWRNLPTALGDWPEHLTSEIETVIGVVELTSERAASQLAERESEWIPIAVTLAAWVELARRGLAEDVQVKQLKLAETALTSATEEIRSRRFDPISKQATALWERLRLQSNVQLEEVALVGTGTSRRVDLRVTVDGAETAALGVVSQGEVNCLALSLFFPRVMLEESPFRFIVIDDPIQAMDPSRVDGLAHVFSDVAKERQLVVFTHDDRLPESLRRLGLPHTLLQVTRRPNSVVAVTKSLDPVVQYFLDARAVAKDDDLPSFVASRIVPGFCRNGIEAACIEAVRRRRIGRGESHESVEAALIGRKTTELASLALFDDSDQGGKVLGEINRRWERRAGDAFRDCQQGTHKGFSGSLIDLTHESQRLAEAMRNLK